MKQLLHGLSWIVLTLSFIWIIKTNFDWEPIIAFIGSIAGIASTIQPKISYTKLLGTWRTTVEGSEIKYDNVFILGHNNTFIGVNKVKIVLLSGFPYFSELHLYYEGEYHIEGKSIYSQYSNIEVVYNLGVQPNIATSMVANLHSSGPEEIVHIDEKKMTLKSSTGVLGICKKVSQDLDIEYLQSFLDESRKHIS